MTTTLLIGVCNTKRIIRRMIATRAGAAVEKNAPIALREVPPESFILVIFYFLLLYPDRKLPLCAGPSSFCPTGCEPVRYRGAIVIGWLVFLGA